MGSVSEVAQAAASWFETRKRESGGEYVTLREGRPEWVLETVRLAHGDIGSRMLPDDYRYEWVRDAFETIAHETSGNAWGPADLGDDLAFEWADADSAMPYTSDRFAWLASNLERQGYCDSAREQGLVPVDASINDRIGAGIEAERREVFAAVADRLTSAAEDGEEIPTAPATGCPQATSADATSAQTTDDAR
jgi:hypothetical protein